MKVKKYTKKPVTIEAIKWDGTNALDIIKFCNRGKKCGRSDEGNLEIYTLEGVMIAEIGDYIIKGIKGEFYPCKPDIFEKTYEEFQEEKKIFKEFEELGYEWWHNIQENVFEFNKYDKSNGNLFFLGEIEFDLDDKEYWSDIQFTMKEHQLINRLLRFWGWIK